MSDSPHGSLLIIKLIVTKKSKIQKNALNVTPSHNEYIIQYCRVQEIIVAFEEKNFLCILRILLYSVLVLMTMSHDPYTMGHTVKYDTKLVAIF